MDSAGGPSVAPKGATDSESPAGLSGLDSLLRTKPRALPWAFVQLAFQALRESGAEGFGAAYGRASEMTSRWTRGMPSRATWLDKGLSRVWRDALPPFVVCDAISQDSRDGSPALLSGWNPDLVRAHMHELKR